MTALWPPQAPHSFSMEDGSLCRRGIAMRKSSHRPGSHALLLGGVIGVGASQVPIPAVALEVRLQIRAVLTLCIPMVSKKDVKKDY